MTTQTYFLPQSLDEATSLLQEHGPALLVMAGGTIAMPLINDGISLPEKVMGLRRAGLNYIEDKGDFLVIGATTALSTMVEQRQIPMLQEAARAVGGWAIRNMGTVGGNLFAPPPAGDFAVALLALDAGLKCVSNGSTRMLPLNEFYTGFMGNALTLGELVAEIRIPYPTGRTAYTKFGRRHANTPAVVTVAANLIFQYEKVKEARLALNAVGPYPSRARKAEQVLVGSPLTDATIAEASRLAAEESEPFTDAIATEWYRRKMVNIFVRRTLEKIAQ